MSIKLNEKLRLRSQLNSIFGITLVCVGLTLLLAYSYLHYTPIKKSDSVWVNIKIAKIEPQSCYKDDFSSGCLGSIYDSQGIRYLTLYRDIRFQLSTLPELKTNSEVSLNIVNQKGHLYIIGISKGGKTIVNTSDSILNDNWNHTVNLFFLVILSGLSILAIVIFIKSYNKYSRYL